jgi:hypothetical protein
MDQTSPTVPCAAYEALRSAVAEKRIDFPADEVVVDELLAPELHRKRKRVDHPPTGSKDTADALAGTTCQLNRIPFWRLVGKVLGATPADYREVGQRAGARREPGPDFPEARCERSV